MNGAEIHIVEDNASEREALQFLLRGEGYRVTAYAGAEELIAAVPEPPACIVTDLMMPRMTGLDLLKRLKAQLLLVPAIVITGYGNVAHAVDAMKSGAFDFVEKPYPPEDLLRCVATALSASRQRLAEKRELLAARRTLLRLTRREREIFMRLARGMTNKTIAHELGISDRTVESHRANIARKLGVSGLEGLIALDRRAAGQVGCAGSTAEFSRREQP